ncbi:MAG: P27 family phage terminase small subunit [Oscillospiraceae bacterium]|jgi:phage terminase small subunit|nr:P27 family phage terminase small subunit [Oscillospiraceae bacterium]
MHSKLRNKILNSLEEQLKAQGADIAVFSDQLKDYMNMWDVKEALFDDIKVRGVVYNDVSSVGVEMLKNNPSVRELNATIKQMQSLLKDLGLTVKNVIASGDDVL